MVFLALDVWAFSEIVPEAVSGWVFAALGTLLGSLLMLLVAWLARMRTWLWVSLVGLALVPAFFGYAGGGWGAAWGHVGLVAVALAAHELVRRVSARFDSGLRADHVTLTVLQVVATVVVLVQLPFLGVVGRHDRRLGRSAGARRDPRRTRGARRVVGAQRRGAILEFHRRAPSPRSRSRSSRSRSCASTPSGS